MIDFLGSDPAGRNEYLCTDCKREFELRIESYEEPRFCPFCKNNILTNVVSSGMSPDDQFQSDFLGAR